MRAYLREHRRWRRLAPGRARRRLRRRPEPGGVPHSLPPCPPEDRGLRGLPLGGGQEEGDPCLGSCEIPRPVRNVNGILCTFYGKGKRTDQTEGGRRMKRSALVWIAMLVGAATYVLSSTAMAVKESPVKEEKCFDCPDEIQALKTGGKHAKINCVSCHSGTAGHLADSDKKPVTRVDLEACGGCHKDQYESFGTLNLKKPARVEKSLLTERSPNPFWDKLMMGHGFTKEHAAPRSHTFMLVDHLIVDRAYGGRFQSKNGWGYVSTTGGLKAGGLVKDLSNAMNCFMCHDPHAAKPRIVRDGLIGALTRPEKDTLWHKDPRATKIDVREFRGGFRKIALLEKYDAKLQCGQCHVEYNCNPGYDPKTGEYSIKAADPRTNHFPFKDVFQI